MIGSAFAQSAGPAGTDGGFGTLAMLVVMFVLLYFMVIQPQSKKAKEQRQLIDALQKGDEVIALGMIGKIVKINEGYVSLEVASGVVLTLQKQTITTLLPKGTYQDVVGK